jgi:LemA protein
MIIVYIILAIVAVLVLYFVFVFNSLVSLKTRSEEAWSDISIQLKRRYDLIPNLINAVKGYAKHEKEVFEKVTKARTEAMGATTIKEKEVAENSITQALKSVFAVAENYPDLKANENFLSLQADLTDTENKIEASRRFYNANVRDLNIKIDSFPSSVVANTFKFTKKELFEVSESQKAAIQEAPKVDL